MREVRSMRETKKKREIRNLRYTTYSQDNLRKTNIELFKKIVEESGLAPDFTLYEFTQILEKRIPKQKRDLRGIDLVYTEILPLLQEITGRKDFIGK